VDDVGSAATGKSVVQRITGQRVRAGSADNILDIDRPQEELQLSDRGELDGASRREVYRQRQVEGGEVQRVRTRSAQNHDRVQRAKLPEHQTIVPGAAVQQFEPGPGEQGVVAFEPAQDCGSAKADGIQGVIAGATIDLRRFNHAGKRYGTASTGE